jgi:hypothetical protein
MKSFNRIYSLHDLFMFWLVWREIDGVMTGRIGPRSNAKSLFNPGQGEILGAIFFFDSMEPFKDLLDGPLDEEGEPSQQHRIERSKIPPVKQSDNISHMHTSFSP